MGLLRIFLNMPILAGGLAASISAQCLASTAGPAIPLGLMTVDGGQTFLDLNNARTPLPACATTSQWAFDSTTPMGQAMFSTLLTARISGAKLIIYGKAECFAGREIVQAVQLSD
jgi:hypothetical protein